MNANCDQTRSLNYIVEQADLVEERASIRLDIFLSSKLEQLEITRSQIKQLVEAGQVTVDQQQAKKAGLLLYIGNKVTIENLSIPREEIVPYHRELNIIYEDQNLLVVDKPAQLSMHPGAGNKTETLLNALAAYYTENETQYFSKGDRPGIVHRLDKDTTGLVVIAKDKASQNFIAKQFSDRTIGRAYQALCFVTPKATRILRTDEQGVIVAQIARDPNKPTKMAVVSHGGRDSATEWKVLERMSYAVLVELKLRTGRTHQIRVHMNHIGSPVIGDRTYGDFSSLPDTLRLKQERFGRQALHAFKLEFVHPVSKKLLKFQSPIPNDFQKLIQAFRDNK